MKRVFLFIALMFSIESLALEAPFLVESDGKTQTNLEQIISSIEQGSIVLLGELHDNQEHHDNQLKVVQSLIANGHNVHLGMEFLNYTDQYEIYKYGAGITSQEEFLEAISWSNLETYDFYSPIINTINNNDGSVLGLNIPRALTSNVAKNGIEALGPSELALLPSPLEYGNELYFERFYEAVGGGHVPEEKIQNYFWSQSIWDDVMSWRALEFMRRNTSDTLVILVGDFHVSYGGGLRELIERKGFDKIKSISQTTQEDLSEEDLREEISPHSKYGKRADWIWVTP